VTGQPDAALDGVYKLSVAAGKPRLKLSDTLQKTTLPGQKQVLRVLDKNGAFFGADAVTLTGEQKPDIIYHPYEPGQSLRIAHLEQEPVLQKVMENGKRITGSLALPEIAAYSAKRLSLLPAEFKRFENPHIYKVGISKELLELRNKLRDQKH
jgi:nicotinate phosphoribosyltransferase